MRLHDIDIKMEWDKSKTIRTFKYFRSELHILINPSHLSSVLEGSREALHVLLNGTVATEELNVGTVLEELALLAEVDVLPAGGRE